MVYQLYFEKRKNCLFDIEFCKCINELHKSDDDKWYLELHSYPSITGSLEFIYTMINESNIQEFYEDCNQLEELRGWLWEQHDNHCTTIESANKLYAELNKELKEIIYNFANKWGLYVNED